MTNDFNDQQFRDLGIFNQEYCQLWDELAFPPPCNRIEQIIAEFDGISSCPHMQPITARLFADVDRREYKATIRATLQPYVTALREY